MVQVKLQRDLDSMQSGKNNIFAYIVRIHKRFVDKNMIMGVRNTFTNIVYEKGCRTIIWLKYSPSPDMALILDDQSISGWEIQLE